MPRPLRIQFENAWYHVMNRGSGHQNIYKSSDHRIHFLDLLERAYSLFTLETHAYCLMDNHYHLLVKTPHSNLAEAMRFINSNYTQYFNRCEKSDGSLFRGRYKAIIIDYDAYLLQISRYIHLNPVTAKIIKSPVEYKWSSYQYYLDLKTKPDWLQTDEILQMFKTNKSPNVYKSFVEVGLDDDTKNYYAKKNNSIIFGTKAFKEKLLTSLSEDKIEASSTDYRKTWDLTSVDKIHQTFAEYFGISEAQLERPKRGKNNLARDLAIYCCRLWTLEKASKIAKKYQCCHGNVSNVVKKVTLKLKVDKKLNNLIQQLEEIIFLQTSDK